MESRTKPLLLYSFTGLLVLAGLTWTAVLLVFEQVRAGEAASRSRYLDRSRQLHQIRTGILLSGTLARDYFINPSGLEAESLREELGRVERQTRGAMDAYAGIAIELRAETVAYWKVLDLMAEMARKSRRAGVDAYFQRQLGQRRQTMMRIADDIEGALQREWRAEHSKIAGMHDRLRVSLIAALLVLGSLGCGVAFVTARRLMRLESETRGLSGKLVRAQEEERRAIARELHDEIGQWLSALRLEIGQLMNDRVFNAAQPQMQSISDLAERSVEALRRTALMLRPSMLDDLGLVPALEWQARETGRSAGIPIRVIADEDTVVLSEQQRTCIFRVAQEALRNCARHAGASRVEVALRKSTGGVSLHVEDDGRGFSAARTRGLGLLGIEERVNQLGGKLCIRSEPGRGTTVMADLPL